jgi:hypothetical protein
MVRDNNSKSNKKWDQLHDNPRNKTVPHGNAENILIDQVAHRWTAPDRPRTPRMRNKNRDTQFDPGEKE